MKAANEAKNPSVTFKLLPNDRLLMSSREEEFDFLLKIATEFCEVPTGWICFSGSQEGWIKSIIGWPTDQIPDRLPIFPSDLKSAPDEIFVVDLNSDERLKQLNSLLKDDKTQYAVCIPILSKDRKSLGFLALWGLQTKVLDERKNDLLAGIAKQLASLVEMKQSLLEHHGLELQKDKACTQKGKVHYSCIPNSHRTILSLSDSILELVGLSKQELLLKNPAAGLSDLVFGDELESVQKEIQGKIEEFQAWELTYQIVTADGKRKWVLDQGHLTTDEIPRLEGVLIDISNQIESKLFYQTIFEHSDSIICIHELEGKLLHFNKAAAESLEYDRSKDHIESIYQFIREEDSPYLSYYFDELERNGKLSITLRLKSKNNNSIYWSCRASKLETAGKTTYMISAWDVTQKLKTEKKLQESENLFKLISENLTDVLYVYDALSNTFDYISPNTKSILGVENGYFTSVNNFIDDFVLPEYKDTCKAMKNNLLTEDGYIYEYPIVNEDKIIWLNESVQSVKTKNKAQRKFVGRVTNITQRKHNFLELNSTKSLLEETGKIARVGGWSYDLISDKLSWTTVTSEIHECGPEYHPTFQEGIDFYTVGASRDLITQSFDLLIKSGQSFDVEAEIITASGNRKWVRSVAKGEYQNDRLIRINGICQDITEKITRIQEQEKNQLMLESIFNELTDVIWSVNYPDYKLLFASPSSQQLTGELLKEYQPNTSILNGFIHPEDLDLALPIEFGLKNSDQYSLVYRIVSKSGDIKWVRENGRRITRVDGKLLRIDGKISHITREIEVGNEMNMQLKLQDILMKIATDYINLDVQKSDIEIQKSLKLIGEFNEADRAYIFDYDWEQNTCSNTFEWCGTGITAEIDNLKDLPLDLIPQWVETHKELEYMYIKNVEELDDEDALKEILGSQNIKTLITFPIYLEDLIYGFVGFDYVRETRKLSGNEISLLLLFAKILANLKNRGVLEEEIIKEKNRAEQTSKYKSEFLSNMSHEIRTPLNGVIGFTDLLLRTPLTHTQKQYAENANIAGRSLLGIVSDILDFSKIEAGKLDLELIEHSIYEIAQSAIDITKFAASQKHLELICNIPPDLPQVMELDPVRLKQVLINLLGNAVKFTESGEVELLINFEKKSTTNGRLSIAIRDTGIGINESQQKKLFKAFSQADSSISRKYGGTGLGLTISNLLIQKMGGIIELNSQVGIGTTFRFQFETKYQEQIPYPSHEFLFKNVLIVDDNPIIVQVIERYLSYWNIPFQSTTDPLEAVSILAKDPTIDLGIIDYRMPEINGVEFIQMIRSNLQLEKDKLQFVLLHSSLDGDSLKKPLGPLDTYFVLIKPINIDELYHLLTFGTPKESNDDKVFHIENSRASSEKVFQILIAEDIEMNMILIKTLILEQLPKAKIFECSNGEIALKTYKNHPIDLVIMDVQMPIMDGLTATRKIRTHESLMGTTTPIIGLTAGALKEEKEKCLEAGMEEFLTKPIQPNLLIELIEKYLLKITKNGISEPENIQIPIAEAVIFDKEALFKLIGYDMNLFKELMQASLDLGTQVAKLVEISSKLDKVAIKSIAHGIKGSCQSLSFNSMQTLVKNLETYVETMKDAEILENIANIQVEWQKLKPLIEEEIKNS